ncbi:hypothetical protein CPB85DRAFT_1265725 [Mucidula mucida]|nr:hypothetical protein CPB85DRAFT_1265725 [Mucidula mucida]
MNSNDMLPKLKDHFTMLLSFSGLLLLFHRCLLGAESNEIPLQYTNLNTSQVPGPLAYASPHPWRARPRASWLATGYSATRPSI